MYDRKNIYGHRNDNVLNSLGKLQISVGTQAYIKFHTLLINCNSETNKTHLCTTIPDQPQHNGL